MYGRGSTPGNCPRSPATPVPTSTAASQSRLPRPTPCANSVKVNGPGARKNTQIQIGQCASRYSRVLRSRVVRSRAYSTLPPYRIRRSLAKPCPCVNMEGGHRRLPLRHLEGQKHGEDAAAPPAAAHLQHPLVPVDDLLAHPQSQPGPAVALGGKEWLERSLDHLCAHPFAGIR